MTYTIGKRTNSLGQHPRYGWNSTRTVLQEWLWHGRIHEDWYVFKQRNQIHMKAYREHGVPPLSLSLSLSLSIYLSIYLNSGPVSCCCKIHQLHLCRRVRLPKQVSWIWYEAIWWWGSINTGVMGNMECTFIAIAPWSTLARSGSTW